MKKNHFYNFFPHDDALDDGISFSICFDSR